MIFAQLPQTNSKMQIQHQTTIIMSLVTLISYCFNGLTNLTMVEEYDEEKKVEGYGEDVSIWNQFKLLKHVTFET